MILKKEQNVILQIIINTFKHVKKLSVELLSQNSYKSIYFKNCE